MTEKALKTALSSVEDAGTKAAILEAAIRLFGAQGFDVVSIRDITAAAGANGAAVFYHFGTKDELVRQAFGAVIRPINAERLRLLGELLERAGDGTVDPACVVRALIGPVVLSLGRDSRSSSYHRFHILTYALQRPYVTKMIRDENDDVARRFIDALARALPGVQRPALWWRFDFIIGSVVHILLDVDRDGRLRDLSGGACETSDPAQVLEQLVDFATAGLKAPASPARASRSSQSKQIRPRQSQKKAKPS